MPAFALIVVEGVPARSSDAHAVGLVLHMSLESADVYPLGDTWNITTDWLARSPKSKNPGVCEHMIHPELFPAASELPVLQEGLDWCELTENELLLLDAAGPRLAESANPLDDLRAAVAEAAPPDSDEASTNDNPVADLLAKIDKAGAAARQAMVVVALEKPWASEGVELPAPGLNAQK